VAVGPVSGLFPSRTSPPTGLSGAGCAWFLLGLLVLLVAIAAIGEACGGPLP
jgi:hypothetical protein